MRWKLPNRRGNISEDLKTRPQNLHQRGKNLKPQKVYNAYVSSRRVLFCFENTAIYEMYHVISIFFYVSPVHYFTDATLSTVSEGETNEVTKLSENAFAAEPVTEDSVTTLLPGTSQLAEKNEEVLPSQKDENETEDVKELESFNSETKSNVNASVTEDDNESKSSAHADHSVKDEPEKCSTLENQAVHTSIAQATTGVEMGTDNQIPDQLQKENAIETDRGLIRETVELEYKNKSKDEAQSDVNKPEFMSTLENVVVSESTTQATTGDEIERSRQIPAQVEKTQENETSVTLSSSRSQQDDKVNSSGNLLPQIGDRELPVSNEEVRTPQLYPELDSFAKKSGKA